MTRLNKILISIIVFLLIGIGLLYRNNINNRKLLLLEEKEKQELIRLENELKLKEEQGVIKNLYKENNVYYFQVDEDMDFILNSAIFKRLRIEEEDLKGYSYLNDKNEIKFEYRYEYVYYPKLVILIDDVGMNTRIAENFVKLDMKLNYAILPFLPRSLEAGDILREAGHTTILHMPMEGSNKNLNNNTDGLLYSNMSDKEIKNIFDKSMANVGSLKGFNNHMGSVFTSNKEKMKMLLEYTKEKGLYFIDSNTSRDTKGYDLAKKLGIPTFKCNGFLDNSTKIEDIEKEIVRFVNLTKDRGKVLVIGHYHQNMVEALKNKKDFIEKSGVKLSYIEEIL